MMVRGNSANRVRCFIAEIKHLIQTAQSTTQAKFAPRVIQQRPGAGLLRETMRIPANTNFSNLQLKELLKEIEVKYIIMLKLYYHLLQRNPNVKIELEPPEQPLKLNIITSDSGNLINAIEMVKIVFKQLQQVYFYQHTYII